MTLPCARCGGPARRYSRRCRECDLQDQEPET